MGAGGAVVDREEAMRTLACCRSEPACFYCPLLPQNLHKTLAELAKDATDSWR